MLRDLCPGVKFTKLPSKKIVTGDNVSIKRGDIVYFRYASGPKPSPYVVIGEHAMQYDGRTTIIVLRGSRRVVAGMDPLDFVTDVSLWEAFYNKRNKNSEKQDGKS